MVNCRISVPRHLFLYYSSFCYIHRTHVHFVPSRLCFAFVYKNKTRFKKLINHIEHPSIDRCKHLTFSWSYRMSFLYENDFFFSHFPTPSVCCAVILRHRVSVGAHRRVEFVVIWSSNREISKCFTFYSSTAARLFIEIYLNSACLRFVQSEEDHMRILKHQKDQQTTPMVEDLKRQKLFSFNWIKKYFRQSEMDLHLLFIYPRQTETWLSAFLLLSWILYHTTIFFLFFLKLE